LKIKILCTLGPASLNGEVIRELAARGVDQLRLNLSHTPLDALEDALRLVRRHCEVPICLDSEGPQVRCGPMLPDVTLEEGAEVELVAETVLGDASRITLWPKAVFDALALRSVVGIDFDGASLRVTQVSHHRATAVVVRGGRVRSNKGVTVEPGVTLPALSEKDIAAVEIGAAHGVANYALSFASGAEDVAQLRALAPVGAEVIAKIESREGVRNMDEIIPAADAVLIDRGDLSREIPIEHVPYYQKAIVRRANRWNRPVYVATNLLESMVTGTVPTVAEAHDIATTLLDGVHGLVLAAETAIGVDPVASVDIVRRARRAFEQAASSQLLDEDRPVLRAVS
jgi:sulfate adenylyltransferase